MPIDKFGTLLGRRGTDPYYQWNRLLRNYVRDNALCMVTTDFDAKSLKIRHVALPVDDGDAVNKLYVQQNVQILKNRQDELEKEIAADVADNIQYMQQNMQILKDEQDKFEKKITTFQHNAPMFKDRLDKFENKMAAFIDNMEILKDRQNKFEDFASV